MHRGYFDGAQDGSCAYTPYRKTLKLTRVYVGLIRENFSEDGGLLLIWIKPVRQPLRDAEWVDYTMIS